MDKESPVSGCHSLDKVFLVQLVRYLLFSGYHSVDKESHSVVSMSHSDG